MRVAGVMSGTSLDGIDVAIVEVRQAAGSPRVSSIGFQSTPYPEPVRIAIRDVSNAATSTAAISRLNFQLGELYARAVLRAIRRFGPAELIGCHGQTIYHEGRSNTLQIGEPAIVAERTGVPVVSNFRARDIAAGGQGAPLVPYVDYLLFRHPKLTRIAVNIGGIANITVIPPAAPPEAVIAFDTGPGNMVIDALTREYTRGKLNYDRGGRIAAVGKVSGALLDDLLGDPYYRRSAPKSTGREQYGIEYLAGLSKSKLSMPDRIATATVLTAATIAMGVRASANPPAEVVVSGGGVHNPRIMAHLAGFLPGMAVCSSTEHGVDADAKEALAFAVLAWRTWRYESGNLPSATGARRKVVLGCVTR